ncbi:hypothetical protein ACFYZ5_35240 [Streptomyces chartreusis]
MNQAQRLQAAASRGVKPLPGARLEDLQAQCQPLTASGHCLQKGSTTARP